jgi:hypothetical protein
MRDSMELVVLDSVHACGGGGLALGGGCEDSLVSAT